MDSEEYEFDRREFLAGLLGAAVPGSFSLAFFYFEVMPLYSMLPGQITAEAAYRLTAVNSLLIFSAVLIWMTFQLMDAGSLAGKYVHWRFFQEGDDDAE